MLGTGNAQVTECYNTCFVLEEEGRCLLVDGEEETLFCGSLSAPGTTGWI